MRRVPAGVVVILLALVVPPAIAQDWPGDPPRWREYAAQPRESDGELVLTLSKQTPGRIVYRTVNGSCTDQFTGQRQSPCSPTARAPEDYGAVSGEVLFTGAGSQLITIPIVDDDLAEGFEAFEVQAHEVEDTNGWAGAATAIVHITDDDGDSDLDGYPAAATTTSTTTTRGQPSGAAPVTTLPPVRSPVAGFPALPTTTASPSPGREVALASGELQPGPGFELVSDGVPQPAAEPGRGNDRSGGSASWLGFGLGSAAVGAGGVVGIRRRRRWSPTGP